jgi:hypothetical protein
MFNSNALKMLLNIPDTLSKTLVDIADNPWWLNITYICMSFFLPLQYAIWFLFALVLIDTISSIYRQLKTKKEELKKKLNRSLTFREKNHIINCVVDPRKFGVPIEKLTVYIILLMIFFVADILLFKTDPREAGSSFLSLTNGILMLFAGREITSIVGHAFEITHLEVFNDVKKYFKNYTRQKFNQDDEPNSETNNQNQ